MINLVCYDGYLSTLAADAEESYRADMAMMRLEGEPEDTSFILADRDDTGDVITAKWPDCMRSERTRKHLACLLYGAREIGQLPGNAVSVLLPDGTEFLIDS